MKKVLYLILTICIICFCASVFCTFSELKKSNRFGEMKSLDKAFPVCLGDKTYLLENETVLLYNQPYGVVQAFDSDGNFIWGVQLATGKNIGANAISYNNKKLYLFEGYSNTIYEFTDFELTDTYSPDEIISDTDFYSMYPYDFVPDYKCKISGLTEISLQNQSGELYKNIELNTDFKLFTYMIAFLAMIVSAAAFWVIKDKVMKE